MKKLICSVFGYDKNFNYALLAGATHQTWIWKCKRCKIVEKNIEKFLGVQMKKIKKHEHKWELTEHRTRMIGRGLLRNLKNTSNIFYCEVCGERKENRLKVPKVAEK